MAVIAGNWKMYHGPEETRAWFDALELEGVPEQHELVVFPPAIALAEAVGLAGSAGRVGVGVQNVHWEDEGAFTGETSARTARSVGAAFALIGHSERRHLFGETDDEVRRKVEAVLRNGLVPVVCVGETIEERRAGRVEEVILRQLGAVLPVLSLAGVRFMVAYEPVWAIGTGETATPEDATAAHTTLRECLADGVGVGGAPRVPILYGGSVKPDNAGALLSAPEVDGVLVGGASLDAASFAAIASAAGR